MRKGPEETPLQFHKGCKFRRAANFRNLQNWFDFFFFVIFIFFPELAFM